MACDLSSKVRRAVRSGPWISMVAALALGAGSASAQDAPPIPPAPEASAPSAPVDLMPQHGPPQLPPPVFPLPPSPSASDMLMPSQGASAPAASAQPAPDAQDDEPTSLTEYMREKRRLRRTYGPPPPIPRVTNPVKLDREIAESQSSMGTVRSWNQAALVSFQFFLWPYLGSAIVGAAALDYGGEDPTVLAHGLLLIPAVGPFATAAVTRDVAPKGWTAVLIADGAVQTLGLAVAIASKAMASHAARTIKPWILGSGEASPFAIGPMATPNGAGLAVGGSF